MILVVKTYFNIVDYGQILEQTDVLEGSCNTVLVNFNIFTSGNILAVQADNAFIWLVNTGKQVEYGGLSGTVRTYQTV